MLYHLRQRVATTLALARCATLASHGPAGLQAQLFPCVARDLQLYLLLPSTSDHLLNLESSPIVVVATAEWQLRGRARVLGGAEREAAGVLLDAPDAAWSTAIQVRPTHIAIAQREGWGAAETIDLE